MPARVPPHPQAVTLSGRLTTKKGTLEASGGGCKACIVCALMVPMLSPAYASRLTPDPASFTFSRGEMLKEVRLSQGNNLLLKAALYRFMQNSSCCRALQRSLSVQAAPVGSPVGKIGCMQHLPVLQ